MMKRFEKMGKIAGLMLLALAFVFAGCQGATDSSSSGGDNGAAVSTNAAQISVDPQAGTATVGTDGLAEGVTVSGHNVDILNGASLGGDGCQGGAGGDLQCWIKIINRDPNMMMTNVFMNHANCKNCVGAQLDNADLCGAGNTCKDVPPAPDVATAPNGSGYCFAEQGQFFPANRKPWDVMGCDLQPSPAGQTKPFQVIHPKCGAKSVMYDFGNQVSLYTFYGTVTATYLPWNPVGANGAPGGGDDDARYDFQNYTTVYLMLADFANKVGPNLNYSRGAYKRSNILAGYSSTGVKSGATVVAGSYFSVNVAVEYPDRIESQVMGDPATFNAATGYEYYGTYAVFFRWDPNVVSPVSANRAGGVFTGVRLPCQTQAQCDAALYQWSQHLSVFNPATNGLIDTTNGFIYFYRQIKEDFAAYTGSSGGPLWSYRTDNNGIIKLGGGRNREGGHVGVAIWDRAFLGGTLAYTVSPAAAGGRVQQGADADPELNLLNYHFWVKTGTSGKGSPIRVDTFAGFTTFLLDHTGLTFYPSGTGVAADWASYCAPYSPGHANATDQHCDPVKTQADYAVFHGTENGRTGLPEQYGEATTPGDSATQNWSVYICVQ